MCVNGLEGRNVWFGRFSHSQKRWNRAGMPNSLATSSYTSHISNQTENQTYKNNTFVE
jgi:hypothetical protein